MIIIILKKMIIIAINSKNFIIKIKIEISYILNLMNRSNKRKIKKYNRIKIMKFKLIIMKILKTIIFKIKNM